MSKIHELVKSGNSEALRLVLMTNQDPNSCDEQGVTALNLAAQFGKADIVNALLNSGADPFLETGNQLSAISEFVLFGKTEFVNSVLKKYTDITDFKEPLVLSSVSDNTEILRSFLNMGCDPNSILTNDHTLVMLGNFLKSESPGTKLVSEYLENSGFSLSGLSALEWSLAFGNSKSVDLLIKSGADVNFSGKCGETSPLIISAVNGSPDNVSALMRGGAKLETKDKRGKSALDILERYGRFPRASQDFTITQEILEASSSNTHDLDKSGFLVILAFFRK